MIYSVFYVSRSAVPASRRQEQVANIVAASCANNAIAGVTVRPLMARIAADERHCAVRGVREQMRSDRLFADWRMAYWGPAPLLEPQMAPLLRSDSAVPIDRAADDMIALMRNFSALAPAMI